MAGPLDGTVALVTGASSGIGEATALALAEHGATVAIAARRRGRLEDLARRIEAAGATALVLEADVTDQTQAERAVNQTAAELGRLDILVNNAGMMLLGPAVDADASEWWRMLDINVNALLTGGFTAAPDGGASARGAPSPTSSPPLMTAPATSPTWSTSAPWPAGPCAAGAPSTT